MFRPPFSRVKIISVNAKLQSGSWDVGLYLEEWWKISVWFRVWKMGEEHTRREVTVCPRA